MKQTLLVLIDARSCAYQRYVGREATHWNVFNVPLTPEHVEEYRKDPDAFIDSL